MCLVRFKELCHLEFILNHKLSLNFWKDNVFLWKSAFTSINKGLPYTSFNGSILIIIPIILPQQILFSTIFLDNYEKDLAPPSSNNRATRRHSVRDLWVVFYSGIPQSKSARREVITTLQQRLIVPLICRTGYFLNSWFTLQFINFFLLCSV